MGGFRLQLAISTRSFGPRPDPAEVIDGLLRLEAPAVAVHAGLPRPVLAGLLDLLHRERSRLPVLALTNYAPAPQAAPLASVVDALRLCSPDREERQLAIAATLDTFAAAADAGAPVVIVSLGEATHPDWPRMARLLARGEPLPERLLTERSAITERVLDNVRFCLDPLLARATSMGLTMAIPNRARFHQVPSTLELSALRAEFRGAPLRPWLDAGAGHTAWTAGSFDPGAWLDQHAADAVGVALADASGPRRGLPPGLGELGYRSLARRFTEARREGDDAAMLAIINTSDGFTDAELRAGIDHIRSVFPTAA